MLRNWNSLASLVALSLPIAGCQGAVWGNVLALGITASLFVGTLRLGRRAATRTGDAIASVQDVARRPPARRL